MKVLLVVLTVFLLGFPLLGPRFIPTHDGEYHIIRFMEFFTMLSNGYFFPQWAPTLNSGFGIPIFLFHYPFPNYIGSFFHLLGFQFVDAFKLTLFSGYLSAGVFCFLFLSRLWDKKAAMYGTIASLTVPYWFLDIYIRGSVGEVWAITWMFAALASIVWQKKILLGISIALLILSHNIQALVFLPSITIFVFIRYRQSLWSIALGLMLASYFWIPALAERSFVVGLSSVNPLDHFATLWELLVPSWGSEFSGRSIVANKMSFQIGIIPVIWLAVAGWKFIALAIGIVFFMLPVSQILWESIPGMSYVQYPWRLLSLFIPMVAISAAYVSTKISMIKSIVIVLTGIVLVYGYARPATYERRDDAYYLSRDNFTGGTSSMGNAFSTIWTSWKQEKAESLVDSDESVRVTIHKQKPLFLYATIVNERNAKIRINTLYFPGWKVYDNGKHAPIEYQSNGLINIVLSPGTHEVIARFEDTPVRRTANVLSILGLLWLLGWAILEFIYAYRDKHVAYDKRPQRQGNRSVHKRAHKRAD